MSVATGEDLTSFCLGHSQDVFQFEEMIEFCLLLGGQALSFSRSINSATLSCASAEGRKSATAPGVVPAAMKSMISR